ncbi:adenosine deaminase family protein [Micromonospora chalcea]
MLPHLHLHLEPQQRKRLQVGLTPAEHRRDPAAFFAAHDVGNRGRLPVSADDLRSFIRQMHEEQRREGVDHVELRLSPRRFVWDGMPLAAFLRVAHTTMESLERPSVRGILLINRDSDEEFVRACTGALADLPATFVGIDLAGDESRYDDTAPFRGLFRAARESGLGVTVHAGEFGHLDGVWRALDELGAQRLGHAVAAARSPSLLKRLGNDGVLVEVSISSNLALGAVDAAHAHPVQTFLDAGVPVCFNTDVPLESGATLPEEMASAARLLHLSVAEVTAVQRKAAAFVFRRPG